MSLKKKFLELKQQLSEHNNAYYNATTLISDLEYDRLKFKYEELLKENPKFVELDDLGVGAAYYEKTDGEPSLEKFMVNEAKLRVANESRGRQKNKIDEIFSRLINGE